MALGLFGVFEGGAELGVFIGTFLVLTVMLGFLFGTFDRIHLTRDSRGRVRLIKTWRICFFAQSPKSIDVSATRALSAADIVRSVRGIAGFSIS